MRTRKTVEAIEQRLGVLRGLHEQLHQAIVDEDDWAFCWYQDKGDEPVSIEDWGEARALVAAHLARVDYPSPAAPARQLVGALACSPAVLAIAEQANQQKAAWKAFRQQLTHLLVDEDGVEPEQAVRQSSELIRRCLKLIGQGRVDLGALLRTIPVLEGAAFRLSWHRYDASPSQKRTLGDVVKDLNGLLADKQYASEAEAALIASEITRLQSLNQAQPVNYRVRSTEVSAPRFSAGYTCGSRKGYIRQEYAGNPVLFPAAEAITPVVKAFELTQAPRKSDASRVSEEPVTRVYRLSGYCWYLNKKEKPPRPQPKNSKNPYASTGFPGMSFWARPSKARGLMPHIRVLLADRRVTQFSIEKNGYAEAWRMAAEAFCEGRPNYDVKGVIKAIPPPSQYQEMLVWASLKQTG